MNIGFFVSRKPHLKILGNLIDHFAYTQSSVYIFYLTQKDESDKSDQSLSPQVLPKFRGPGVSWVFVKEPGELANECKAQQIHCLVTLEGYHVLGGLGMLNCLLELRQAGIALFSLAHFFETARLPLKALEYFDINFMPSEYSIELMLNLNRASRTQKMHARARLAAESSPLFDQFQSLDRTTARVELNLPLDRPIIVVAAPVLSPVTSWRWVVWRESDLRTRLKRAISSRRFGLIPSIISTPPFEDCVNAIREFCSRENAFLVVKSRSKQDDPIYLQKAADIYLDGGAEEYYPSFTTHKLLVASDLVISAQSMSLIEAVVAGTPALNINTPYKELKLPKNDRRYSGYLESLLGNSSDSLMNYPGCIWSCMPRTFPQWLGTRKLEDFAVDPLRRQEYLKYFLNIKPEPSSVRITHIIQNFLMASKVTEKS